MNENKINIFWFRRDLRLHDNVGFHMALKSDLKVLPIFIFDTQILDVLQADDPRVTFIYESLLKIQFVLQNKYKSSVAVYHGNPLDIFQQLMDTYSIHTVYTNHDYEPYARKRDREIKGLLQQGNVVLQTFKDQVIFEKSEIVKQDGNPYVVYTPYKNKWKEIFKENNIKTYETEKFLDKNLVNNITFPSLSLDDIGFKRSTIKVPDYTIDSMMINSYESKRNYPAIDGTSLLGPHLRFGTVSIREIVRKAISEKNDTFLKELIWREFFMQILWHFPQTKDKCFKEKYERIEWRNNEEEFKKWCNGETGYPIVDAGMRQLNETGYMHNRVRMIVGSFLCKHLLIDWRWGEAYFAEKLLDYEMSSNVGNWQWVAGCGVDAAPYFRIFNPYEQVKKFDKNLKYINKWITDFNELTYPSEIVNHKMARERCLETYKIALQ